MTKDFSVANLSLATNSFCLAMPSSNCDCVGERLTAAARQIDSSSALNGAGAKSIFWEDAERL